MNSKVEQELMELVEITGANRVAVIRKAIERYREDQAVNEILVAQQEVSEGKILRGDIEEILMN
jgi:hypothetical protein